MSYYSFKIKKDKLELAVISEDKYFVITQFDKVYREITEKAEKPKTEIPPESKKEEAPVIKGQEKVETASVEASKTSVNEETPQEKVEEIKKEEIKASIKTEEPLKKEKAPEKKEEPETSPQSEEEKTKQAKAEIKEPEISLAPESQKVKAGEETGKAEEVEGFPGQDDTEFKEETALANEQEESLKTETKDDFQKIIEEKLKEEEQKDEFSEESPPEEIKETISYYQESDEDENQGLKAEEEIAETLRKNFEEKPAKSTKVYDILQEKLASLPEEEKDRLNLNRKKPEEKEPASALRFKGLDDLIYLKKPQTKLDYLLVTSYFLKESEKKEKYSLKQINSKIIPQIKEPIDHSVVHESIAHGYFEVIPDTEGTCDITEYSITEEGVDYLLNEL